MHFDDHLKTELHVGVKQWLHGGLEPPPHTARLRRVFHGMALVPGVLRVMWNHPPTRTGYVRIIALQVAVTVMLGLLFGPPLDLLPQTWAWNEGTSHIKFDKDGAGFWSIMYGTLCTVEWLVIALSRDFHDELSLRASLLMGVPGDEATTLPRLRLNLAWCWRKLKRRIHGAIIFALGIPLFGLLTFVPWVGDGLNALGLMAWGIYWLSIFTLGRTALAWQEQHPADPWFLRLLTWVKSRVNIIPAWSISLWRRLTGAALRPAALVEAIPWESLGLALMRVLGGIPVFYLLVRPIIPVAAACAVVQRDLELRDKLTKV